MERNTNIRELLEDQLLEVAGLTSRREYNMALIRARQSAEQLVREYAKENGFSYETLADTIEELYSNGVINRNSRDSFHNIRILGNKAVHEGDNEAEDARNSYYMLKDEIQTFMSRKVVNVDRTPVMVEREALNRRPAFTQDGNSFPDYEEKRRKPQMEEYDDDDYEEEPPKRRRTEQSGRYDDRNRRKNGGSQSIENTFSIYMLLRILIPVIAVVLIVLIVKKLIPSKAPVEETTVEITMEETEEYTEPETETETEPPTTEAPKPVEYKIKGEGVNIRYYENQERVYTQLNNGTKIGTVEEIEGSDFVKFVLDDVAVVVRKDFIVPIEE